jgi:hypothetical protein
MYSPAFQTLLVDARIEDVRRGRAGVRRLVFADPSRAN